MTCSVIADLFHLLKNGKFAAFIFKLSFVQKYSIVILIITLVYVLITLLWRYFILEITLCSR